VCARCGRKKILWGRQGGFVLCSCTCFYNFANHFSALRGSGRRSGSIVLSSFYFLRMKEGRERTGLGLRYIPGWRASWIATIRLPHRCHHLQFAHFTALFSFRFCLSRFICSATVGRFGRERHARAPIWNIWLSRFVNSGKRVNMRSGSLVHCGLWLIEVDTKGCMPLRID
jgi:hypothetical protein